MKLTEHQVNFFNTFGYLAIPNLFSPNEIAWITEEFEMTIQEFGGVKTMMAPAAQCSEVRLSIVLDSVRCLMMNVSRG